MKVRIENALTAIKKQITSNPGKGLWLMGGEAGTLLFRLVYSKNINAGYISADLSDTLQEFAEKSMIDMNPSFATGRSGINWLFTFLNYCEVLDKEDRDFLCDDDTLLEVAAKAQIKNGNADFLHGGTGIAHYLLYAKTFSPNFFSICFDGLEQLFEAGSTKSMIPFFDVETNELVANQVNLSLSHGITAILKLCLECCKGKICEGQATALALKIIAYLKEHVNHDKSNCYFPNNVFDDRTATEFSRLAWCYGDLTIGYILYQAGVFLKDPDTIEFALKSLEHSAQRYSLEQTSVYDCGLCHGSAGIAHIFNKLWHDTNLTVFKKACDHWILATIEHLEKIDWSVGYQRYNKGKDVFEYDDGFLEGAAGIGLALISYLYGDFDWDHILMLN